MVWVRVDNRLVHGQIIETWLPFTGARVLVVVNDMLADDFLRQEIMSLAIPRGLRAVFVHVAEAAKFMESLRPAERNDAMVLFANCKDARRAYEKGLDFGNLNIGNLHYGPGKKHVCAHVALSGEDESCLRFFTRHGVRLDFRCVPNDPVQIKGYS